MAWGWRGRGGWCGPWPGRGPFSYLPPWMRPGWWFGPGSCWQLLLFGWLSAAPWTTPPAAGWPYWSSPTSGRAQAPGVPSHPGPPQYAPPPPEEEAAALERAKKALEEELKGVEARIEELRRGRKE